MYGRDGWAHTLLFCIRLQTRGSGEGRVPHMSRTRSLCSGGVEAGAVLCSGAYI